MNWDDLEDILYYGTENEINGVLCPECGGELITEYYPETRNVEIFCEKCGTFIRDHGAHKIPNFALYKAKKVAI